VENTTGCVTYQLLIVTPYLAGDLDLELPKLFDLSIPSLIYLLYPVCCDVVAIELDQMSTPIV